MTRTIVDTDAAYELYLYADNTYRVYFSTIEPTTKNLMRKVEKGVYDHDKALVAWSHVADAAAKEYAREFKTLNKWYELFNAATRRAAAEDFARDFENEYIN